MEELAPFYARLSIEFLESALELEDERLQSHEDLLLGKERGELAALGDKDARGPSPGVRVSTPLVGDDRGARTLMVGLVERGLEMGGVSEVAAVKRGVALGWPRR